MSSWIVANVPSWLLLILLVVLIAGGAVLVRKLVRSKFPQLGAGDHNDATRFAYGVVGFVYAFFIGFVVSGMWSQINTEDGQARDEGTAGIQLARDLTAFDQPDADRIRQALLEYERAALAEWPQAVRGYEYPQADKALQRVYLAYQQVQPHNDTQKTFLSTSFGTLDKMSKARTERVMQAQTNTGPSFALWTVILLTSGLVLTCAIIYGVEHPRIHSVMVATVGVLVAANLFLVLELSHPFVGEMATSPDPLRDVITVLSAPST